MGTDLDEALVQTAPAPASPRIDRTETEGGRRPTGPELSHGMRLGHFQITKKLGAGGMGEVYLATDLALDRPVAIKVLPAETTSGTAHDRMVREARAQARVTHKNVAHIYFIGEDSGRLYFAMEYVTGETLADRTAKGPVPVEEALSLIHDAVLGLREAQRSGFTHRDVKPSNLMVDGHGVVKVLDFGLAAGAPEHAGSSGAVAQTTLAGTPLYMAPEQARGEPVDFRADIYALGATLFQLVCGRPPFQAQTAAELRTMHESAERPTLRGVVPRTQSTALDSLIARMMAPRREDRFASYDELLHAIELASTQYTRPAGFWVRASALGIDMMLVAIVSTLVHNLIVGNGDYSMSLYGMPLAAILQLLVLGRWGTTIGFALFELEVVAVETGRKPSWRTALVRTLWMYGPLIAFAWLIQLLLAVTDLPQLALNLMRIFYVVMLIAYALALVYASLRRPGKRADWDRWSGTMVRYRTSRVRAAGG